MNSIHSSCSPCCGQRAWDRPVEKRETLGLTEGGEGREEVGEILKVGSVPGTPPDMTAHQWVARASLSEHLQGHSWFYLGNFSTASPLGTCP